MQPRILLREPDSFAKTEPPVYGDEQTHNKAEADDANLEQCCDKVVVGGTCAVPPIQFGPLGDFHLVPKPDPENWIFRNDVDADLHQVQAVPETAVVALGNPAVEMKDSPFEVFWRRPKSNRPRQ